VWEVRNVNTGQGMQRQTAFFTNTVQDPASWVDDTGFELNLQPGQYRFVFTLVAVATASSAEESHEVFIILKRASFTLRLL
jgi:hypothetical protein